MRISSGIVFVLAACNLPGRPGVGTAEACLVVTGDIAEPELAERATWTPSGTLVGPTETAPGADGTPVTVLHPCGDGATRWIGVTDEAGATWWTGFGLSDADGVAIEPELALTGGAPAALTFRSIRSFGDAAGFVLTVDDRLAIALENGTWGPALEPSDVPGLRTERGDVIGHDANDCGAIVHDEIVMTGDTTVTLVPFASAPIAVNGVAMSGYAVASWDYDGQPDCTDVAGERVWAVFPAQPETP